jgi:hypothetical protein
VSGCCSSQAHCCAMHMQPLTWTVDLLACAPMPQGWFCCGGAELRPASTHSAENKCLPLPAGAPTARW